jgi:hypothetical protein
MTRKAPKPLWRSMGRYGDDRPWDVYLPRHVAGEPCDGCLADRYTATARIRRDKRGILALSVTDRFSGATFGWAAQGRRVTLSFLEDATQAEWERLWRDGREIVGIARKQTGGRQSEQNARIAGIEEAAVELGEAATRLRVAARLGKVDATGSEEWGQYRDDVRAGGGWDAIMKRVRARRESTGK